MKAVVLYSTAVISLSLAYRGNRRAEDTHTHTLIRTNMTPSNTFINTNKHTLFYRSESTCGM